MGPVAASDKPRSHGGSRHEQNTASWVRRLIDGGSCGTLTGSDGGFDSGKGEQAHSSRAGADIILDLSQPISRRLEGSFGLPSTASPWTTSSTPLPASEMWRACWPREAAVFSSAWGMRASVIPGKIYANTPIVAFMEFARILPFKVGRVGKVG
jgi:hypothetical protein